ncbi:lysylphosphatidylglycerol synthase domain-containing protein [Sporocytophaga myxococcoides]|uniref:lysylphosphatidylglycerol synthase domain-containing protein n=1 Tax=Sporocytophaga myxococcoides TaxID=153721 RepID=UPI0004026B4D|nr:lysylphosphatidylglycerol synthase domain-containing protein [Sporocytophaga myxococcoides]
MQVNHILSALKEKINPNFSLLIKSLVFIVSLSIIFYTVNKKDQLTGNYFFEIINSWKSNSWMICFAFLLMPINWGIEGLKWKLLASKVEKTSFFCALEGVICGTAFGFITPHGLGDYLGRILNMKSKERSKALGAIFLSRIAQFYSTIYFGSISVFFLLFSWFSFSESQKKVIIITLLLFHILLPALFFFRENILRYLEESKGLKLIASYFLIIKKYDLREILLVIALSASRYLIFLFQFVLVFNFFRVKTDLFFQFLAVPFVLLVKSVIPTIFDLGVREAAVVFIFEGKSVDLQMVLYSSLTVWLLNVLTPSMVGLFLIFRLKIKGPF